MNEKAKNLNHWQVYFSAVGNAVKNNLKTTMENPSELSPFAMAEREGRIFRFPGGAAFTAIEEANPNPLKSRVVAEKLSSGQSIHIRSHAQVDPALLYTLFEKYSNDGYAATANFDQISAVLDSSPGERERVWGRPGGDTCSAMSEPGGVTTAIKKTEKMLSQTIVTLAQNKWNQIRESDPKKKEKNLPMPKQLIIETQKEIQNKMKDGEFTVGVELPGNLTVFFQPDMFDFGDWYQYEDQKGISRWEWLKNTEEKDKILYTFKDDQYKRKLNSGEDKESFWLGCVDERVLGGEHEKIGDGSFYSHNPAMIVVGDSLKLHSSELAAAAANIGLETDYQPASDGALQYLIPYLSNFQGQDAEELALGLYNLWEMVCTESNAHLDHSGQKSKWRIKIGRQSIAIPQRQGLWDNLKKILDVHNGTVPLVFMEGTLPDEVKKFLAKRKVPMIEISMDEIN